MCKILVSRLHYVDLPTLQIMIKSCTLTINNTLDTFLGCNKLFNFFFQNERYVYIKHAIKLFIKLSVNDCCDGNCLIAALYISKHVFSNIADACNV